MSRSMFYSTMLLTAASFAMRATSMVFQVYLSNHIGAAGIGLLQLTMTVAVLAMTVGTAGVRIASMVLCAEEYGHGRFGGIRRAMGFCFFYGFLLSAAVGLALIRFSDPLALRWIQDLRAASSLRIVGLFLPVTALWSILGGYFTAVGKIGRLVVVEIFERLLSIAITIVLLSLWAGGDLERACCVITFGSSAASAVSLVAAFALYRRDAAGLGQPQRGLQIGRRLIRLSVPLGLNDCLRSGISTAEHLIIPRGLARCGSSQEQAMAAYGTIHGMVFPILMFPAAVLYALSDLLVPELAKCTAAENDRRVTHLADKCLRMGMLFAAAVAGCFFCTAAPMGRLIYHSTEAGQYLRLFAPLVLILYMDAIVDGMHKGLGQQVQCVRYNTITSSMDVILLFFLLPKFGIAGYFFSFTVCHAFNFYLSIARLIKVTGYAPPLSAVGKALSCAAASAAAACLLMPAAAPPLTAVLLGGGLYLALFALLSICTAALSQSDLLWLRSVVTGRKKRPAR